MKNIICVWYGAVVDIPSGWALCDGNNGTPDLRNKILIGAGGTHAPGDNGSTNVTTDSNWPWEAWCWIMKL